MRLTLTNPTTNELFSLDVPSDISLSGLKECISAELSNKPPPSTLHVYRDGKLLKDNSRTLEDSNIKDGEMIAFQVQQPRNSVEEQQRAQREKEARNIELIRLQALGTPSILEELRQADEALALSVQDPAEFERAFRKFQGQRRQIELARAREVEELNNDPFNVEAQKKIEELIRIERVMENLETALEHHPEVAFGHVHMLYIPVEVNGVPVKAFVDSGAEATVMSPECAQRCSIMRLVDTRFQGIAQGVGTAKILGHVHSAPMKIGGLHLPCRFTVMEGKHVELLLGLDMLKRHQACIDLKNNRLTIQDVSVEFLPESEIPKRFVEDMHKEPIIEGPGGAQIGGISGAVTESTPSESQPSQLPPPQQQPPDLPPRQQHTGLDETSIATLMDIGMSREEAIAALGATNGDVEMAANLHFH